MSDDENKQKAIEENAKKVSFNLGVLDDRKSIADNYPSLYKVIKGIYGYLWDFNLHSKDRVFNADYTFNGNYYFFVSNRYIANLFGYSTHNTWNRNINLFCALGLIYKLKPNEVAGWLWEASYEHKRILSERLGISIKKVKEVNYYCIPRYSTRVLEEADSIAKDLLDNKFRLKDFNKIYLIKVFGQEFADDVFPDDRMVTAFSDYVAEQIEKFIIRDIKRRGYTTLERIRTKTYINLSKVKPNEYGFHKGSKRNIIDTEFGRSFAEIKKKHYLEYRKAKKEHMEKYHLKSSVWIIHKHQ